MEGTSTSVSAQHFIPESMAEEGPGGDRPHHQPRRLLGEYNHQLGPRHFSSIARPTKGVEIKLALLSLITANQFAGMDHEDPYTHLSTFYELIGTMGIPGEDEEAVYLRLFPFSLTGKANTWLQAHPNQSLTRWEDVERKFLARFFPPSRYISAKSTIATFSQGADEPLCEAWERYKSLLRKCPNHGFDDVAQLNMFCNGLRPQTKMLLDASAGGSMMMKDSKEAITIIDVLAANDYQAHHDRSQPTKRGILELDTQNAILAQNKLLSQQMEELKKQMSKLQVGSSSRPQQVMRCDFCAGDHPNGHCTISESEQEEEVNYMNNPGRQGNFSSNYNQDQGWRNNQNQYSEWKQEARPSQRQPPQKPYQNQSSYQLDRLSKMEEALTQFIQVSTTNQKNTEASIRNLEVQIGQLAKQLAEQQSNNFSANTQVNPKEYCQLITTRRGTVIGKGIGDNLRENKDGVDEDKSGVELKSEKEVEVNKEAEKNEKNKKESEKNESRDGDVKEESKKKGREVSRPPPVKNLPYPHAPSKKDKERQFARFLDIIKRLQINIPFAEALEQMPSYARFMKELLTKKRKLSEDETVELEAGCSAIIQKSLPQKSRDPGSFTLLVTIGNLSVGKALLDLGASINLMPLSMLQRIGDVEVKPTKMTLQLADRSIKYPHGIVEDLLVKVDKFWFPVDFVVMDMEEDSEVPLILGRPFMKTAKVIIDVDDGKLKVRVHGDEVNFNIFEAMKHPNDKKDCFRVDVMDEVCLESERKFSLATPVEKSLNLFDMKTASEKRKLQLHELEEMRLQAYDSSKIYKSKVKSYHDKKIVQRNFQPGQQALLLNSRLRLFPGKFKSKWSGPFVMKSAIPSGAMELEEPNSRRSWMMNGQRIMPYLGGEVEKLTTVIHLKDP
ncbi:uncharacterized protein LOC109816146 [Cajanus cajan]|uniref:uncharacterized protein LOC109816146 n=1 Tax=Cajanus cajan TaxID=3821 RepID=UPI00098D93D9|nr:uncharacterized protein LOC109816146 [Cajanus cajan]